jgi:ribonuclease VapC
MSQADRRPTGDDRTPAANDALEAYSRYGKGSRHPAQLNLGDCFAYAHAASLRAALLFKGDGFSKTDVECAG